MTNSDAISARLYPYDVGDDLIAVACMDAELPADEEYAPGNKVSVAKAAIDILKQLVVLTSEGQRRDILSATMPKNCAAASTPSQRITA